MKSHGGNDKTFYESKTDKLFPQIAKLNFGLVYTESICSRQTKYGPKNENCLNA